MDLVRANLNLIIFDVHDAASDQTGQDYSRVLTMHFLSLTAIENYLVPTGILGPKLMDRFRKQFRFSLGSSQRPCLRSIFLHGCCGTGESQELETADTIAARVRRKAIGIILKELGYSLVWMSWFQYCSSNI